MKLKVVGTGSKGNSYILEAEKEALIIECGVRFSEIKKALKFNLSKVSSCLYTHVHLDHSKAAKDVVNAGIKLYGLKETHKAMGIFSHHNAISVVPFEQLQIGSFKVMPFDLKHDVPCLGFLIKHPDCGVTCFITDTYYSPYTFDGLNNIIIEANYSKEIIDRKMAEGANKFVRDRVLCSHLSLENCLKMLKSNDLKKVNHIVLIHLSNNHSDEVQFKKEVFEATGKNVTVAFNGLEMNLSKTPF